MARRGSSWGRVLLPQTTNGEGRVVYLNALALATVARRNRVREPCPFDVSTPEKISVPFARACRKIGVIDFRFHDLRHTAASSLRMRGADIHTVAQILGHKDLRMAARYQHLSPVFLQDAVRRLDGLFDVRVTPSLPRKKSTSPWQL